MAGPQLAGAIAVLSEFMKKDMTRIRNKSAFVNGIIDRVQKELVHDKVCPLCACVLLYYLQCLAHRGLDIAPCKSSGPSATSCVLFWDVCGVISDVLSPVP